MYLVVDIDSSSELNASHFHSSKKAYTPMTRYDAQYSTIKELVYDE